MEKHEVSPYKERKLYLSMGVVSYWLFISFVFRNQNNLCCNNRTLSGLLKISNETLPLVENKTRKRRNEQQDLDVDIKKTFVDTTGLESS